jgi:hypothetical protein
LELFAFNFSALKNNGGTTAFIFSSLRFGGLFFLVYGTCHLPALIRKKGDESADVWSHAKKTLGVIALASFLLLLGT